MGIGSVTSINNMSGMQMTMAGSADPKIKSIQNEITGVEQQLQMLSSKEELSVSEKTDERKKLKQEISGLNTELKQHEEALRKSQKREIRMTQLQEDQKPANDKKSESKVQSNETTRDKTAEKTSQTDQKETVISKTSDGTVILKGEINQAEKRAADTEADQTAAISLNQTGGKNLSVDSPSETAVSQTKETGNAEEEAKGISDDEDTGLSSKEMRALISADAFVRQSDRQETVIAKIDGDIVILKSEMNLDEKRGVDTERKESELEKLKRQRAMASQFSVFDDANSTRRSTPKTNVPGTRNELQVNINNNAVRSAKEESQASQQMFYHFFQ